MMISKETASTLYVWIWLPNWGSPVVAGKLVQINNRILFTYGQSYLERKDAIAVYEQELPLKTGTQEKNSGIEALFGCIRDSAPDAWGRRVILNKLFGIKGEAIDPGNLNEFTYLIESGSDRIGALDFQTSATIYQPRISTNASLLELSESSERVEQGIPLTPELAQALNHGTSIGGARPKALLDGENKKYVAKFSSSTDQYNVIKAEFVAMTLAKICGLNVAYVQLEHAAGKDILLIERFDRNKMSEGWSRKLMLSALTLLNLDEMTGHYASYQDFAELIRHDFTEPRTTLKELFGRMVFNVLSGNTDDHARNHSAFWDGKSLALTPAYDLCPQMRAGGEASQAMIISGADRSSKLITCLNSAHHFMLDEQKARNIIDTQINVIKTHWDNVCEQAKISIIDNRLFRERLFLNKYAFQDYEL